MILDIAKKEVKKYPRLKPDLAKMRDVLTTVISSAKHFCWVSENCRRRVTGVLVAVTNENMWAQRQCSNVVLWVSEIVGDGYKLLKQFKDWITFRRAIKVAGFAPDSDEISSRVWKLVERMGFKRYGGAYLFYN